MTLDTGAEAGVWTECVAIHAYEADFKHHATLDSLCRCFLEGAWNHAEYLGVGFHQLAAQQKFWVLSRMTIEMERYPCWGDQLKFKTWPRGTSSIFALRDFEIYDSDEMRLGGGTSAWLVLDTKNKRPQRLEKLLASVHELHGKMALGQDAQKLTKTGVEITTMSATAHYSDIDANGHVNSARYIGWILDSYSLDFHREHRARRLEINYVAETLGGESVSVSTNQTSANEFAHSIIKSNGQEVCRARVFWIEESDAFHLRRS
jgi:acyl-ACP thioesterase